MAGGVPPPQRREPSQSRFACQLSQRESQGSCAPFLPPAFMRGEGHAVAGGVPRRSGDSPLSHASRAGSPKGRDRRDSSCFPIPFNGEIATVFRQPERNRRKPAPLCGCRGIAYFARSSRISCLSQAPTVLAVTLPPFMTTSVGMLATWNSMARSMA